MQIKFLTIYDARDRDQRDAQSELLEFWQNSIVSSNIDFINTAKIAFTEYFLQDYYDQEKLTKEINYRTSYHLNDTQFWQALGKRYDVFKDLYNELACTHKLMELVITVEDI